MARTIRNVWTPSRSRVSFASGHGRRAKRLAELRPRNMLPDGRRLARHSARPTGRGPRLAHERAIDASRADQPQEHLQLHNMVVGELGVTVIADLSVRAWPTVLAYSGQSCRRLEACVTAFGAQGLELDATLVAWGTDLVMAGGQWSCCCERVPKGRTDSGPLAAPQECVSRRPHTRPRWVRCVCPAALRAGREVRSLP